MILYDEETTTEVQPTTENTPVASPIIVDNSTALSYEDIYQAVYNGYMDAYTEIKIREAEEKAKEEQLEADKEALKKETEPEPIYKVSVENFPLSQNVRVNNYDDFDYATINDAISEDNSNHSSDMVEFATGTDSKLYTATAVSVGSADQQAVAYMLDIRNCMLLFMLLWFVLYLVKTIKNTFIKFTKGKGDSV